ncbi:hypothetical protein [Stenotrophomonas maltophilia]|uniref:hypothetical protein n=1 Tax=Stenotrophomonas maltophilia TaxID=40324 RepID=UPI0039C237B8
MTLITCGECGKSVSDQAAACPGCGAPTISRSERRTRRIMWGIVLVLGLPVVLFFGSAVVAGIAEGVSGGPSAAADRAYTGTLRGNGIEWELTYASSPAGGQCEGWYAVSVQKPGDPASGMRDLMCWRSVGDQIEINTATGEGRRTDPRSNYVD